MKAQSLLIKSLFIYASSNRLCFKNIDHQDFVSWCDLDHLSHQRPHDEGDQTTPVNIQGVDMEILGETFYDTVVVSAGELEDSTNRSTRLVPPSWLTDITATVYTWGGDLPTGRLFYCWLLNPEWNQFKNKSFDCWKTVLLIPDFSRLEPWLQSFRTNYFCTSAYDLFDTSELMYERMWQRIRISTPNISGNLF